jgi:hypothetical protein
MKRTSRKKPVRLTKPSPLDSTVECLIEEHGCQTLVDAIKNYYIQKSNDVPATHMLAKPYRESLNDGLIPILENCKFSIILMESAIATREYPEFCKG